ncbi:MAG: hypothetical protein A2044_04860 [Candidatus Firestonebacteria bacterium GWA2_43_8]|nr:MAG: hypothetical protein A2044_04860 [Candidatus Firestonebacteria bacterium GWA2_43_8]
MKVYIMVDIEGIAGMIFWDNRDANSLHDFEKRCSLRRILTNEVNAAVEGAIKAGAKEIIIWDSHGDKNNFYLEDLHPEAEIIIGYKGLPSYFPLLDRSFDAGMYIGGHAMAGTPKANLPHTITPLNGKYYGEVGMFAVMCGFFDVPMVFVSGDKAVVNEVQRDIPNVGYVITKEAFGPYSAKTLAPKKAQELIRKEVEKSLRRKKGIKSYKITPPYIFKNETFTCNERINLMAEGKKEIPRVWKGDDLSKLYNEVVKPQPLDGKWGSQDIDPEMTLRLKKSKKAKA